MSPMDGVSDAAMRYMTAKYGKPDVMFSEFVSVDALHYATGERRVRILKTLIFTDIERPVVAQVFGHTPEFFAEAAELIENLGFDGIDINMGCPAHKVEEQGSGAGLIRTPKLAQELIRVTREATVLPVSVKTRIGINDKSEMEEWIKALSEAKPVNISLHGRTLKQLYQGSADWEIIGRAAEIVHKQGGHILGNGDVESVEDAKSKIERWGVDGVLIGRAAEGNPGIFAGLEEPTKEQRFAWMVEHAKIYEKIFEDANPPSPDGLRTGTRQEYSFLPVRKHLAWYCRGFPGAVELRSQLMQTNCAQDVREIIKLDRG
ncbi:MAG: tRNA-dihydrouridine synthase [Microgenomates group bacterium GW2011_GWC2_46_7]|nr:MAG: tRNA-dihydrouridine synthase [Microgenomates group bacterium GW2011_GWC2_46_7]